jgi:hypothetical protein
MNDQQFLWPLNLPTLDQMTAHLVAVEHPWGACFQNSLCIMKDLKDQKSPSNAVFVFGTIKTPPDKDKIYHAWIELDDKIIVSYPKYHLTGESNFWYKSDYYQNLNARVIKKFSSEEISSLWKGQTFMTISRAFQKQLNKKYRNVFKTKDTNES